MILTLIYLPPNNYYTEIFSIYGSVGKLTRITTNFPPQIRNPRAKMIIHHPFLPTPKIAHNQYKTSPKPPSPGAQSRTQVHPPPHPLRHSCIREKFVDGRAIASLPPSVTNCYPPPPTPPPSPPLAELHTPLFPASPAPSPSCDIPHPTSA